MTDEAQFKKEVKDRKKEFEEKKVELISRLCADEAETQNKERQTVDGRK